MAHRLLRSAYLPLRALIAGPIGSMVGPTRVGRRDEVTRYLKHARLLAGALAMTVGLTLVAPPAFAATPAPGPLAAAATAKVESAPAEALVQAAQAAPAVQAAPAAAASTGDKPFLKTTKGVLALALLAGGLGYTVYSFSNDRVSSPQR
jgi:hypothetical protein